jgi:hypothetical protein
MSFFICQLWWFGLQSIQFLFNCGNLLTSVSRKFKAICLFALFSKCELLRMVVSRWKAIMCNLNILSRRFWGYEIVFIRNRSQICVLNRRPTDRSKLRILPNILHCIGETPLVRITRIGKSDGLQCEICEYTASIHFVGQFFRNAFLFVYDLEV